ncbi:tyrosine-type recombinase/integrase [Actinomadura opuntiae]|uniref:tyrosine-type recombinase/integrase n=1 Tax=Actinomadura sp. OS1-43 TaxID=604315 RepID=UPI00255B051E|nr:tyrosine-type recombinase/integrase [Actinomadura sp. OS1-43]MDL4815967.1 tyrosine-type recombinase/integrase [Actinomadura sp. OS1-43]
MIAPYVPDINSFRRHLRAENKSKRTTEIYVGAATKFARWLAAETDCANWEDVEGRDVQDFTIHVLDTRTPGYANNLYRAVQQFFRWWSGEFGLPNPMWGLKPPMVPEKPVPVLTEAQLAKLLKTAQGRGFVQLRDTAILMLLMDAGLRRGELAGLKLDDIDLDYREVVVTGKGRRQRTVPFGHKTALALDRYLKARAKQRLAHLDWLWLGTNGSHLTASGIFQMIERRGNDAGISDLFPHMLRHTWSHYFRLNGGSVDDLMRLAGWKSVSMAARYGASAADQRARAAGQRLSLGDRI